MAPDPSQDDLRRRDDVMLDTVGRELALLKQGVELGAKANEARFDGLAQTIAALSTKLDRVIDGQTEPGASPAGRQMLEKIVDLEKIAEAHNTAIEDLRSFKTSVLASFRTLRAQMTIVGFILGVISGVTAVATFLGRHIP